MICNVIIIFLVLCLIILIAIGQSIFEEKQALEDEAIRRGYGKRTHRTFEWLSRGEVWGKINAEIVEYARKEARDSEIFKRIKK